MAVLLEGVMTLFAGRILPFAAGKGFPTPDGYIAAIAAAHDFAVASQGASAFKAAGLAVIDPWSAGEEAV